MKFSSFVIFALLVGSTDAAGTVRGGNNHMNPAALNHRELTDSVPSSDAPADAPPTDPPPTKQFCPGITGRPEWNLICWFQDDEPKTMCINPTRYDRLIKDGLPNYDGVCAGDDIDNLPTCSDSCGNNKVSVCDANNEGVLTTRCVWKTGTHDNAMFYLLRDRKDTCGVCPVPPTPPPVEPPTSPPVEPPTPPPVEPPTSPPVEPPTSPPVEPPTSPPTDAPVTTAPVVPVFYEDVPDMSDADITEVMDWIKAEVTILKNPFCWRDSYGRGVGTIPGRVADCPDEYTHTIATCTRGTDDILAPSLGPADCPSGYTNTGITCTRGTDDISAPSRVASCPSGYTNTGLTCFRAGNTISAPSRVANCPGGCTNIGIFCYCSFFDIRGTGSMSCPGGYFINRNFGRCYKNCPSGYTNTGEQCTRGASTLSSSRMTCPSGYFINRELGRCYKNCPSGYTNTGEFCHRPLAVLGTSVMTCPEDGYFVSDITGRCHVECPNGYTNTGETCHRPLDVLDWSHMTCSEGEERIRERCFPIGKSCHDNEELDAGLCYERCEEGYAGAGPVCWQGCPNSMVECAFGCAIDTGSCVSQISDQVVGALVLAANVASLGLATPATAAITATATTIRVGNKVVAGTTKVGRALVKMVDKMQTIRPPGSAGTSIIKRTIDPITGDIKEAVSITKDLGMEAYDASLEYRAAFAEDFVEQTSEEINDKMNEMFTPATSSFLKAYWGDIQLSELAAANGWQIANSVLSAASIVDITGVTGVLAAYANPACFPNVEFPDDIAGLVG